MRKMEKKKEEYKGKNENSKKEIIVNKTSFF